MRAEAVDGRSGWAPLVAGAVLVGLLLGLLGILLGALVGWLRRRRLPALRERRRRHAFADQLPTRSS